MDAAHFTLRLTCGLCTWEAVLPADEELTLLELLEKLPGVHPPHNCVVGACNTCRCAVHCGGEFLRRAAFGRDYTDADHVNTVLACIAGIDRAAIVASSHPVVALEIAADHHLELNANLATARAR